MSKFDKERVMPRYFVIAIALTILGVCVLCYMVFSLPVLGWWGYVLYVTLSVTLIWRYMKFFRARFICGKCGAKLHAKGRCTRCKTINV